MDRNRLIKLSAIILVIGLSLWHLYPSIKYYRLSPEKRELEKELRDKAIHLGLDLQGGMHLVLEVDTKDMADKEANLAVEQALTIIRNRVDQFGVAEPVIQRQGKNRIIVQLPGIKDPERAKELIGKTALLEFKLVKDWADSKERLLEKLSNEIPPGYYIPESKEEEVFLVEREPAVTGRELSIAAPEIYEAQPEVSLEFTKKGAGIFSEVTGEHVGDRLAIILDDVVYSAPVIREKITGGKARISGRFTMDEAKDLAVVLRCGALPSSVEKIEERTVGPSLGQDSINKGVRAVILGLILVALFMLIYYRLGGLIADFCLLLVLLFLLAALAGFKATLTLPGIAGIVLTIGMAVDANVLIYERIREELKTGRTIKSAIANGYDKAFSAIFDSNLTTLIAAFFLFQFGTGPIRGFALTLTIGIIASMFSAIVVSRIIFELLTRFPRFTTLHMFKLIGETKIDFIGRRRLFYALSTILIGIGLITFFLKGKDAYGIDFTGGQLQEYAFQKPVSLNQIRTTLKEIGLADASIQQFENPKQILIRTSSEAADIITKGLSEKFPENKFEILRLEKVGPSAGKQLRSKAISALLWALIGILIYVGFRFKHFNFALAGVIALFHDCLVTIGLMVLTNRRIDLLTVTALLSIAGYSINDTIVIYDRVRENLRTMHKESLFQIINLSVNQTLSRTILTSLTTVLVVIAIYFFGGEVLKDFAFALLVGFIAGIYSTVFIASPIVVAWQKRAGR